MRHAGRAGGAWSHLEGSRDLIEFRKSGAAGVAGFQTESRSILLTLDFLSLDPAEATFNDEPGTPGQIASPYRLEVSGFSRRSANQRFGRSSFRKNEGQLAKRM
jgi:hypothetical protein